MECCETLRPPRHARGRMVRAGSGGAEKLPEEEGGVFFKLGTFITHWLTNC